MPKNSLTLALVLSATALSACGGTSSADSTGDGPVLAVSAGFYPYEFVAQRVGGDDVAVTNLTTPGAEPHDLELSPQQVAALGESDLVLYSRGFQPAVDEAVDQQAADRALDVLTTVELREGEHADEEGEHSDEGDEHAGAGEEHAGAGEEHAGEEEAHADEGAGDPHVWLDPLRLATITDAVADRMAELAPDRADAFRARAAGLTTELEALDEELRTGLADCRRNEIVTSHDAFGYLAGAYGLEQVSISGLSPEDEASPKRLAEVATFAKENGVTTIFFEELVSPKVAQSLASEVGAEATVLSPVEGPPRDGDYMTAMRANLEALRTALDCA